MKLMKLIPKSGLRLYNDYGVNLYNFAVRIFTLQATNELSITQLPKHWVSTSDPKEWCLRLSKLENLPVDGSCLPTHVLLSFVSFADGSWLVHAYDQRSNCEVLHNMPTSLTPADLEILVTELDSSITCPENGDEAFCQLANSRKGVFKDCSGKLVKARLDTNPFLHHNGCRCYQTVRTVKCEHLVHREGSACSSCRAYRPTVRSLCGKQKSDDTLATCSKTNWLFLSTPERKGRFKWCREEVWTEVLCESYFMLIF